MSFTLEEVVPWGRSFDEYAAMFALSQEDLDSRILGCGDGPASFNAELTARSGNIVSVDPLYRFSQNDIRKRIDVTFEIVVEQTRKNEHEFVWNKIGSVDELARLRIDSMNKFLLDYPLGLQQKRYVYGELPVLGFTDREFDLALCSHFLFLYSEHLSEDFHVKSILELCRIAGEVRIFPLLELGSRKSRHLDVITRRLTDCGCKVIIETVSYEFQRGGNQMLRVKTKK